MKKTVAAICLLGLMILVMTGCGNGNSKDTSESASYSTTVAESLEKTISVGTFNLDDYEFGCFPQFGVNDETGEGETIGYEEYVLVHSKEPNEDGKYYIGLAKLDPEKLLSLSKEATEEENDNRVWNCPGEIVEGAFYGDAAEGNAYAIFHDVQFKDAKSPSDMYCGYAPAGKYKMNGVTRDLGDDTCFSFWVAAGDPVELDVPKKE